MWNTRASLALKRGEPRAVHYWWVTHIANKVTNPHAHSSAHALLHAHSLRCPHKHTHTYTHVQNTGYISSPGVFNNGCWHTYSTCYTLGFEQRSLWSIWDCHWPCTLHYLADRAFDPTVRTELSPSLMLSLAGSRVRFHYGFTLTRKHARTHTMLTRTDYVLIMI